MGLDMYLERFPRYKDATPMDINAVASLVDLENYIKGHPDKAGLSFKEYCGYDMPSDDIIDHFKPLIQTTEFGFLTLHEEIGYWRKANAIHNWFVNHIQDGEDDCEYRREVTLEDLRELYDTCKEVLAEAVLVPGKILSSTRYSGGKWYEEYTDGLVVADPEVCEKLLPSTSGFFFGSTEYNESYIEDINQTIGILEKAMETDFDHYMIYYVSSW